ncbi:LytTR family DNA-binding domain-containing protein [Halosquirtibacter xylanolyticus]|uniref:LytR/AlgR family response regulator transcription factor n=1 Tax=Halosquirtibacter xylanolyticus TaxID=3374599 RepID=UPI00374833FE|nr:LytTR family DNA-binding domain-containing protein [Prolixibacteraceae bacterium]
MRVLIIEDEWGAQELLKRLLLEYNPDWIVADVVDSVRGAISYLDDSPSLDLIFMDVHLSDGISFEIFDHVEVDIPIIFITAYDQYAIKAFKHNGVDYILKPLIREELFQALDKVNQNHNKLVTDDIVSKVVQELNETNKSYRKSFLIQSKDSLIPVMIEDVMAFYVDMGVVKCYTRDHVKYVLPLTLDQIEKEIDPAVFFRVSRQYILNMDSIQQMKIYFNGKLKLHTVCEFEEEIIVSKQKASMLKKWFSS